MNIITKIECWPVFKQDQSCCLGQMFQKLLTWQCRGQCGVQESRKNLHCTAARWNDIHDTKGQPFILLFVVQKKKKNPIESQRRVFSTFDQNFDFKIKRDHKKNSYKRRAYESVDVRSLFWVMSHRSTESSTPGLKGLYLIWVSKQMRTNVIIKKWY